MSWRAVMEQREPASSPCQAPPGYWGENDPTPVRQEMLCGPACLKRILVFFWAVWFSVVFLTNSADALKAAGLLDASWAFASGNFRYIQETTARYGTPHWANAALFAGVILWEGLAAALFWNAGRTYRGIPGRRARYAAFTAALLLWAAFLLADEMFIAYAVAAVHLRLFIAQLATLLALELLPDRAAS